MQFLRNVWSQIVVQCKKLYDAAFPQTEDKAYAPSEIVEQASVPKKRRSGSQSRKAGQTSRRNRVQRQAKGRSKKR